MRIAVVGAGSIGSLVAARLALAGMAPILFSRPSPHLARVQEHGLRLDELDGTSRTVRLQATSDPAAVRQAELVIVLVKTWATEEAVAPLRPHLAKDAGVLTLQNGLGNADAIRRGLGEGDDHEILVGATTQGAIRIEPGRVRHTGSGTTVIGREDGRTEGLVVTAAEALTAAGLPTVAVPDVERWVWRKLAVNAAINPLTALAGVPNGAIAEDPDLREVGLALAAEVAAVARARGLDLADAGAAVLEVSAATAANRSSMLRDLEAGNQTELEAINGAVVAEAERLGVAVPANRLIAALVRARVRRRVAELREEGRG